MWHSWSFPSLSAVTVCPVPEIYAQDLDHGRYLEEDLATPRCLNFFPRIGDGATVAPRPSQPSQSCRCVAALSGRGRQDLNYKVCYRAVV